MIDKTKTPEEEWDKVKKVIFKSEVPQFIENLIQKGFSESESEVEKWDKLLVFVTELQKIKI